MNRQSTAVEGFVPTGREKFYIDVPFEMPPGVVRLDVRYEYTERISSDPTISGGNTVDIGLFDGRGDSFLNAGFRGWSGSERLEFFVTPTEATPGYLPGPMPAGTWNACLGFYKVGPRGCHYKVEFTVEFGETDVTDFPPMLTLDSPNYHPTPHADGWYKGELHCHTVHSDGDSTAAQVIAEAEKLGLDFLAITDHNNLTHLVELAALGVQKIILIPGDEVTTYRGHWNVWELRAWVDFRVTQPEDMQAAIDFARQNVFLTSLNHPRQYGPPWEYPDVRGNQCIEVWNGPWRFFNIEALTLWETRLRQGEHPVAVGGSDMHQLHAEYSARLGVPTTWIYCPGAPTSEGLLSALRAGHSFLSDKPDGARLYLSSGDRMMGDTVQRDASGRIDVTIRAVGAQGMELQWIDGGNEPLKRELVTQADQEWRTRVAAALYVRAQLVDPDDEDLIVRALTNPIYVE